MIPAAAPPTAAVLGAGNAGTALAAELALRGVSVALVKTSRAAHEAHFTWLCRHGGQVTMEEAGARRTAAIPCVTRELEAVRGRDVVILCVRTDHHEALLRRLAPLLEDGQTVLFVPGYFSTAYALRYCEKDVAFAEAQSAFLDCRITEPGLVRVGFRNVRNPIGVYPAHRAARAQQTLDRLGIPFTYLGSVAEAALHNPNMIVHPVGAVMSIAGMERAGGDFCMYHETFTPAVWRLLEALDGEKMDVLAALGLPRVSYAQACRFRNTLDDGADGKEVFMRYAAMPERAKGPLSLEDRYFTEDIPQGLVLLESLGAYCGAATPVAASLIGIASACLGRDLREDARTVDRLGRCEMERLLSSDSTKAE